MFFRACLGKMIVYIYIWLKNAVFRSDLCPGLPRAVGVNLGPARSGAVRAAARSDEGRPGANASKKPATRRLTQTKEENFVDFTQAS